MFIDPSLADTSIHLEYDDASALKAYADTSQIDFDEWYENLGKMSEKERKKTVLDRLRSQLSLEDAMVVDAMVELLEKTKESSMNTDIEYITKELEKKFPDINELAVLQFYIILNSIGIVTVKK